MRIHINTTNSNGQKLSCALEKVSITYYFFGFKNAKINFLKKLSVLRTDFYPIEVQVITNPSRRLEKHQKLDFFAYDQFI